MYIKVIDYNIRSYAIRWRISTCMKEKKMHFCASSYGLRLINIFNFNLEYVNRGPVAKKRELWHSTGNTNMHKSHT